MTTKEGTKTIAQLLRERRDGGPKAPIYRRFEVSPGTYDWWEADGGYIPGDEHAKNLAEYLDLPLEEVVMTLYRDRLKRDNGGYRVVGLLTYPLIQAAA